MSGENLTAQGPTMEPVQPSSCAPEQPRPLGIRILGWLLLVVGVLGAGDLVLSQLTGIVYPYTVAYLVPLVLLAFTGIAMAKPRRGLSLSRWYQIAAFGLALLCFGLPFVRVPTGRDPFDIFSHLAGVRLMAGPRGFPAHLLVYAAPMVVAAAVCILAALLLCFSSSNRRSTLVSARVGLSALLLTCLSMVPWHIFEISLGGDVVAFKYDIGFYLCLGFTTAGIAIARKRFTQLATALGTAQ